MKVMIEMVSDVTPQEFAYFLTTLYNFMMHEERRNMIKDITVEVKRK